MARDDGRLVQQGPDGGDADPAAHQDQVVGRAGPVAEDAVGASEQDLRAGADLDQLSGALAEIADGDPHRGQAGSIGEDATAG